MRRAMTVVGLVAVVGCGTLFSGFKEYCQEAVDCLDGNNEDEKACMVHIDNEKRLARVYGCQDYHTDYLVCMKDNAGCEDYYGQDYWTDGGDCNDEYAD